MDRKHFYRQFLMLMIPMALKELISSLVNLADTVMVGRLGEAPIAALGIANQYTFVFVVLSLGICSGAGVFSAQFFGAGDTKSIKKVLGVNIQFVFAAAMIFFIGATFFPEKIMMLFRDDPEVVMYGAKYLKIVCFSYLLTAVNSAYDISVCCTENAYLPFFVKIIGLVVNIALNFVLIFGLFGAPALGVEGAAIATVVARLVEFAIMISTVYAKKYIQAATISELLKIPKELYVRYIKSALPVIFNEMAWALGITVYTWVFSRISTQAVVMITIINNVDNLFLVFFRGGGCAAGVVVGRLVGAENYDGAYESGKRLISFTAVFALMTGIICIIARPLILLPYNISESVYTITNNVLVVTSFMMAIKGVTFLLIVGVFRNGGDTKGSAWIDAGTVWFVGVPLVLLAGLVFHFTFFQTYLVVAIEEIAKIIIAIPYFASKKWIKNVVK